MPHFRRRALFIDGPNLYHTARALGIDVDFCRLLNYFGQEYQLSRAYYYTTMTGEAEYQANRPLIDWLDHNGFTVRANTLPRTSNVFSPPIPKVRVQLAVDAMQMAEHVDEIVLVSGDGDFRSMVSAIQRRGVIVVAVSSLKVRPAAIADELRRQADIFLEINDLREAISRPLRGSATAPSDRR